ncbi:hypothetical protein [Actinorugispora endophytica]|uniref:Uncharacterized protein n=1 Tax=Actinorugispora endophytica TaxID=1605990 RepID=A0A4R6UH10_9ACTN|nr:hypothetical protein [Actinorugispora endophytica]TDQ45612.1 hypothetical protein EV190_13011 [Actinorugispora endophytica]
MVTTVSRALAALLAAMLVLLCAPSVAAQDREDAPARSGRTSSAGLWPHAVAGPVSDSFSIALALAKWSGEQQRAVPRDLPDGYTPPPVSAPGPGHAWGRVPPPESGPPPDAAPDSGLPPGRAPPLTTLT